MWEKKYQKCNLNYPGTLNQIDTPRLPLHLTMPVLTGAGSRQPRDQTRSGALADIPSLVFINRQAPQGELLMTSALLQLNMWPLLGMQQISAGMPLLGSGRQVENDVLMLNALSQMRTVDRTGSDMGMGPSHWAEALSGAPSGRHRRPHWCSQCPLI